MKTKNENKNIYADLKTVYRLLKEDYYTKGKQSNFATHSGIFGEVAENALVNKYENTKRIYCKKADVRDLVLYTEKYYNIGSEVYADGKKFYKINVEIKSGCGSLDNTPTADLVYYCPCVNMEIAVEKQFFVFTAEQWQNFLLCKNFNGKGKLLKYRNDGKIYIQAFYSDLYTYDIFSIGRPKSSQKLSDYVWNFCFELPTVAEFMADLEYITEQEYNKIVNITDWLHE